MSLLIALLVLPVKNLKFNLFVLGSLACASFLPKVLRFEFSYHPQALISIDPVRAREDPVIVKNIPYYNAKKALEVEVMKFDPPPRPQNWGVSICHI